jgi:hypothetical protein
MPEWRKIFEAEDSDFGGGAWVPWKCVLPMKWVRQVPRIWEPRTQNRPKQTTITPRERACAADQISEMKPTCQE